VKDAAIGAQKVDGEEKKKVEEEDEAKKEAEYREALVNFEKWGAMKKW
jgi:hypothetical protein